MERGRITDRMSYARALRACDVPFVALEMNVDNVRKGRAEGHPAYYGDATSEEALRHAHVEHARRVVLLMNDPQAALRVVDTLRRVAPNVPVLMRTRYLADRATLLALGARDVVVEEVEGAAEVVSTLLRSVDVPEPTIDERLRALRSATGASAFAT